MVKGILDLDRMSLAPYFLMKLQFNRLIRHILRFTWLSKALCIMRLAVSWCAHVTSLGLHNSKIAWPDAISCRSSSNYWASCVIRAIELRSSARRSVEAGATVSCVGPQIIVDLGIELPAKLSHCDKTVCSDAKRRGKLILQCEMKRWRQIQDMGNGCASVNWQRGIRAGLMIRRPNVLTPKCVHVVSGVTRNAGGVAWEERSRYLAGIAQGISELECIWTGAWRYIYPCLSDRIADRHSTA